MSEIYKDGENYRTKTLGIKEISLEQYRRCAIEGSGNIFNDPAQRERYINAVKSLQIILSPEILNNEEMKERITGNEAKITVLENKYKTHLTRLKDKAAHETDINRELLQFHYEKKLLELIQEKLIILSVMLKKLNYYGESDITDG
jgi:hypothetical protein